MTACMTEGDLRACLDGELRPPRARFASEHLLCCPRCRSRIERLRSRAATVTALMHRLEPGAAEFEPDCASAMARIQSQAPSRRSGWMMRRAAAAAAGILALLLLSQAVRRPIAPESAALRKAATPGSGLNVEAPAPSLATAGETTAPTRAAGLQTEHAVDYFLELDDGDPIQMGFVVRMSLPALVLTPLELAGSGEEIQADVIIDEGGRARAVRFPEIDISSFRKDQR